MRIDEALGESKPLAVQFGKAVLNVVYRPPAYTIEQMVEAQNDGDNPERLVTMIQDLILEWDLTRIEKVIVEPNGDPVDREVPVDVTNRDDVRKYVPTPVINGIIRAIRADNEVTGE